MTQNNIVVTVTAICGVLVALLNYFKSRRTEQRAQVIEYKVNGRFEDLLVANRELRETLTAITGDPNYIRKLEREEDERRS